MSKKIIGIGSLLTVTFILTMLGCSKTTTVLVDSSPTVTGTISFSKDIQPVLSKTCAISGCHSGTIAPNLSSGSAYNTLISGKYINTGSAETSEVYLWLTGKRSMAMPSGTPNNPSNINALILAWVKQGAKNN